MSLVRSLQFLVEECLANLAGVSEAANIINTSLRQKDRVAVVDPS
jgi:hypothetical protein